MNAIDVLLLGVIAAVLFLAVRSIIRRKGTCSCGGSGGCCCGHCDACRKPCGHPNKGENTVD